LARNYDDIIVSIFFGHMGDLSFQRSTLFKAVYSVTINSLLC